MKKFTSGIRVGAWSIMGIIAASLVFSGCKKSDVGNNNNVPVSGLMAFNLAPDVSAAGFTISGNSFTYSPLAFNSYTGGYVTIYSGSRPLQSYNYNTSAPLATTTYTFDSSKYYSAFLVGKDTSYQNIIVNDNIDSLSPSTQSFVRYINAIPDASVPAVIIAANGTNVINDNAAFTSVSSFTAISPGAVTINVTNGGTINANRTITLEQGKVYTILLSGLPGGTSDNAVQVKYILNGTVNQNTGRMSSSSANSMK